MAVQGSGDYSYEAYVDNWSGGNDNPTLPSGSQGNHAFCVPNADGTWDNAYAIPPSSDTQGGGLAIGGWNASQGGWPGSAANPPGGTIPSWWHDGQTNGLYYVMTTPDNSVVPFTNGLTGAQARQTFITNIVNSAVQYGYSRVIMDYENYGDFLHPGDHYPPDPSLYTGFLKNLETALKPHGIPLEMPISPSSTNQQFYDLQDLINNTSITFQPMCFDYGMGQTADGQGNVTVEPNADVQTSLSYLKKLHINSSTTHNDFMIGGENVYVYAENPKNGDSIPVIINDKFQI